MPDGSLRLYNNGTNSFIQVSSLATGQWDTWSSDAVANGRAALVGAAGMVQPATNGAPLVQVDGTNRSYQVRDFDQTTQEHADFEFPLPGNYDGGNITVYFGWTAASGAGTVAWELNVASLGNSDVMDSALTDVGSATDTLISTAGLLHITSMTWSTSLPTAGELVTARVSRDVANDTLTADARLSFVLMSWVV